MALGKVLHQEWEDAAYSDILGNKTLYVNFKNDCYKYVSLDYIVVKSEASDFF